MTSTRDDYKPYVGRALCTSLTPPCRNTAKYTIVVLGSDPWFLCEEHYNLLPRGVEDDFNS